MAVAEPTPGEKCVMSEPNIVNIVGGLGNQLFQYLFGLTLEARSGVPTLFDVSDFARYGLHDGLVIESYFDLKLPLLKKSNVVATPWLTRGYHRKRMISKLAQYLGHLSPVATDSNFELDNLERPILRTRYFRGYWQSQPYNEDDIANIVKKLTFRDDLQRAARIAQVGLDIDFENSAAVHIRRGDYMKLPRHSPLYPLPLDYYYRAMERLAVRNGIKKFYIFSDNVEEVRAEFSPGHDVIFVDSAVSRSAGVDLCLMSKFAHIIISNSTFGWWAAALRRQESGTVTVPAAWLNPDFRGRDAFAVRLLDGWDRFDVFSSDHTSEKSVNPSLYSESPRSLRGNHVK